MKTARDDNSETDPVPAGAYTTEQVIHETGVSGPTLSVWSQSGYIVPSVRPAVQGGKAALWSKADIANVLRLRAVIDLVKEHFQARAIAALVAMRQRCCGDQLAVLTPSGPRIVDASTPLSKLPGKPGHPVLVLL